MVLTDAGQDIWQKRWFVLRRYVIPYLPSPLCLSFPSRPYLHVYSQSNEVEEIAVINLDGTNVDSDPQKELLLGVSGCLCYIVIIGIDKFLKKRFAFTLFTSANSYALAAPNLKELQSWTSKLDPTRLPS